MLPFLYPSIALRSSSVTPAARMLSSGTGISHSHLNLQTSFSRQPVLTLNKAIVCKCAGNSPDIIDLLSRDIG